MMRYYKRLNVYKTQNMVYHPDTVTAITSDRWCFCTTINGLVIFNAVKVSYQVTRQQRVILNILQASNIDCFMIEHYMGSLDRPEALEGIITSYKQEISLVVYQMSERSKTNQLRLNEIRNLEQVITVLQSLIGKAS